MPHSGLHAGHCSQAKIPRPQVFRLTRPKLLPVLRAPQMSAETGAWLQAVQGWGREALALGMRHFVGGELPPLPTLPGKERRSAIYKPSHHERGDKYGLICCARGSYTDTVPRGTGGLICATLFRRRGKMSQPQSQAVATTTHSTQSMSTSNQSHSRGESSPAKRSPSPRQVTPRSSQKSLPPHPTSTHSSAAKTFTTVDEDGIEHIHHASPDHTNVHTECGRHGDDWLFGGWNLGQVFKGLTWGGRK